MPPLLSVDDVAHLLNVSRRAVYRLVEGGGLPHHRLVGRNLLRFRESDLESWIDSRASEAVASPGLARPAPPPSPPTSGIPAVDWAERRRPQRRAS